MSPEVGPAEGATPALDDATEAALLASRALVGVAARSLAGVEQHVTLVQYRALVLLAGGPQNVGALAKALDVHPSTVTRLCDRLLAKDLIERETSVEHRREVNVKLSPDGSRVVEAVMSERRKALRRILARLEPEIRTASIQAFTAFGSAAGEIPADAWKLGWTP
jgi:DNA-binding MarR family transcriptional regulator